TQTSDCATVGGTCNDVPCDGCTNCHFDTYLCPAGGSIDVTTTLVPGLDTFTSGPIGGMQFSIGYANDVRVPGAGVLPEGDPTEPTTPVLFLTQALYNGLVTFFDKDGQGPPSPTILCPSGFASCLDTALSFTPPLTFRFSPSESVPFVLLRAGCTPGQ